MTPLYKRMKANGTSFYAFPGAAEDISAAYQNQNYKMYFSKYLLLNFPKQDITLGSSDPTYFDFDNQSENGFGFKRSLNYTSPDDYKDQLVESLRNYVANHEVTMKQSKINNTDFYYDNTLLNTPTEKIFWKWCRKLNLISFEPANNGDEYFGNLTQFASNNENDPTYFGELLWREREVVDYPTDYFREESQGNPFLEIHFSLPTTLQIGDCIEISGLEEPYPEKLLNNNITNGRRFRITNKIPFTESSNEEIIITDCPYSVGDEGIVEVSGIVTLVYHRLIQFIGEVNGINNVQQANRAYTEVYIHVPDSSGKTPDILFRTVADGNYKPNMSFPILPSQYQPEIMGAEIFSNPIVSSPNNYPGGYFGQFDTEDFTYETSSGDSLRRSGDYYGVNGNINTAIVDSRYLDGVMVDFDPSHYVKMNIIGKEITNFDQFNAMEVNNQPPQDFEFNAILWYYTVEDVNGNRTNNLYGISFVDNPDNNPIPAEGKNRIPAFRKLAANNLQDGTSYAFSLNLNFNIINDNPQDTFNPEAINSLFSFNLFNESMRRLSAVNDSFLNILVTQNQLQVDLNNMKQLLYSQSDFQVINKKITNLESLLRLYATNQLVDSDSIRVEGDYTNNPPLLRFRNIDPAYNSIFLTKTSTMYNINGSVIFNVNVPQNKSFMIYVENDDINSFVLPNNDRLTILLDRDLYYKQSFDFIVDANTSATQNKFLDLFIKYQYGVDGAPIETQIIETLNLPIYFNTTTQLPNLAASTNRVDFQIDLNRDILLNTGSILSVPINSNLKLIENYFKIGETFVLDNFTLGTSSQSDFSGQYTVKNIGSTNSYVFFDISSNPNLANYGDAEDFPLVLNSDSNYLLSNIPHLKLNKGFKYRITRVDPSDFSEITERYYIEKFELLS